MDLEPIFRQLAHEGASDIHLRAGLAPLARKGGRLVSCGGEALEPAAILGFLEKLGHDREAPWLDGSYALSERHRFRVHAFRVQGHWAAVLRVIPETIPSLEELRLPGAYRALCELERGLVLLGGETRSGRSTSFAAMLRTINESRSAHLVVIEEPIEHLYRDQRCSISQIEVRTDAPSWEAALETAIRSDADVIGLSVLRGERLVSRVLEAVEMGFLVLAVTSGQNAVGVLRELQQQVSRERRESLGSALATRLQGICCQRLVGGTDGALVPVCEVLLPTGSVRESIARGRYEQLPELLEDDLGPAGMQSYDQHLVELVDSGRIPLQTAIGVAGNKMLFEQRFSD